MALRPWVTFGVLVCAALSANALSLGRARSVTLLGKPLELLVPLSADTTEDLAQLCPEADVYFGDTRLGSTNVSTTILRNSGAEVQLRVRTSIPVDEPVVTVFVRAGCAQKSQRRFVLLTDVESDTSPLVRPEALALADRSPAVAVPNVPGRVSAQAAASSASALASGEKKSVGKAPSKTRPAQATGQAQADSRPRSLVRRDTTNQPASATVGGKSGGRLRVDTFDPLTELNPLLKGSSEMLTAPNEEQRKAAAALWRAINAQPQDVLRDAERLQGLETNVKSLQAQSRSTLAAISEVRVQLEQARKERYANPLVYGLLALLLAALGALGFLWSRSQGAFGGAGAPWWRSRRNAGDDEPSPMDSVRVNAPMYPEARPVVTRLADGEIDEYTTDMLALPPEDGGPDFEAEMVPAQTPVVPAAFGASELTPSRTADAEELFDVQQQADFFVSLGQYDQAIEVLQNHISDNVETSALAYLDLLDIYVKLGRREDYDALRQDFNRVFNGQVPDFDHYTTDGRGIEAYQTALSRIEQLWNEPKVLGIIEESLFRKPDHDSQAFDLQAYRELLLLYSVAKENATNGADGLDLNLPLDSGAVPSVDREFSLTSVQPLSTRSADRSLQTTPLSDRDLQAALDYAQSLQTAADTSSALDIDLGSIDPDSKSSNSDWIEFDLDELKPTKKT